MTTESAEAQGWRCAVTWTNRSVDSAELTLELDRNLGGMWPRVVLEVAASNIGGTSIRVAEAGTTRDELTGANGFTYSYGIAPDCEAALAHGASTGLGRRASTEVIVYGGGYSADTAEVVCRNAAELATLLLISALDDGEQLQPILESAAVRWSS